MDNEAIMRKDKVELSGILRESLSIAAKNPKFLLFTVLTSFPLFLSLLLFEFFFHETLFNSVETLLSHDDQDTTFCNGNGCYTTISYWRSEPLSSMRRVIANHSHQFVLLGFIYLILVHPLDLLNTILILCHSSALYAGEVLQSFRAFLRRPIKDVSFEGPLITSLCVLGLSTLVTIGLISLGSQLFTVHPWQPFGAFESYFFYPSLPEVVAFFVFMLLFGGLFLALLIKYIEWSLVWNVGIVISVLEEKHGDIAIGVAAYLSRGSRRRGFLLMLVFLLWRLGLRLLCVYLFWGNKWGGARAAATVAQVLSVCLGNLFKWVVLMVYYWDCKRRFLEKKIDVEGGKSAVHK